MKKNAVLIQRYLPHYRVPLYNCLYENSKYNWDFQVGLHPGIAHSGLPSIKEGMKFKIHKINNIWIGDQYIIQRNINLRMNNYVAMVFEMTWPIISNPLLLLRAKMLGIKCIGWSKGLSFKGLGRRAITRMYKKFIISLCDALIVYGDSSLKYFFDLGFQSDKVTVAQNTIDTGYIIKNRNLAIEKSYKFKKSLSIGNRKVVGYLGQLTPKKQVNNIIRSYAQTCDNGLNNTVLIIAGDGPERQNLVALASSLICKNNIYFIHDVPVGDEMGVFQMFDLYLSYGGAGLGVIEAMAHGKPVLSIPEVCPELELIKDGETGFFTDECTIESFSKKLIEIIPSSNLLKSVGSKAKETILNGVSIENMVTSFDNAINISLNVR